MALNIKDLVETNHKDHKIHKYIDGMMIAIFDNASNHSFNCYIVIQRMSSTRWVSAAAAKLVPPWMNLVGLIASPLGNHHEITRKSP